MSGNTLTTSTIATRGRNIWKRSGTWSTGNSSPARWRSRKTWARLASERGAHRFDLRFAAERGRDARETLAQFRVGPCAYRCVADLASGARQFSVVVPVRIRLAQDRIRIGQFADPVQHHARPAR